jgi:hypothetical protein
MSIDKKALNSLDLNSTAAQRIQYERKKYIGLFVGRATRFSADLIMNALLEEILLSSLY